MLSILGWIIFGLIIGALAKLLMPGRDPGGIIVTILLGIVGALLGGFLGRAIGFYGPGEAGYQAPAAPSCVKVVRARWIRFLARGTL